MMVVMSDIAAGEIAQQGLHASGTGKMTRQVQSAVGSIADDAGHIIPKIGIANARFRDIIGLNQIGKIVNGLDGLEFQGHVCIKAILMLNHVGK